MILEDNFVEKFLSEKASTNIIDKVNELKKLSNFSNYEEINVASLLSKVNLEELENSKAISLEIAKLSVHLLVDFNYFSRFSFKKKYDSKFFEERLKVLGYKNDNGVWKYPLTTKPDRTIVLENVFIHHIINELLNSKDNCDPDKNESSDIDDDSNTTPISNGTSNHSIKLETERINDNKKPLNLREIKYRTGNNSSNLRETWICKRCTFVNDLNISNCETCFLSNATENEKILINSQSENHQDDKKCIHEKLICDPETIIEGNSPISLKSNQNENPESIHNNEEKFNLNDQFNNVNDQINNVNDQFNNVNDQINNVNDQINNVNDQFNNVNDQINNVNDQFNNVNDQINNVNDQINNVNDQFNNENDQFINADHQINNEDDESIATNETSECFKCKEVINKRKLSLCDNCSEAFSICPNEACTKINKSKDKFCKKCKVKNDSNLKDGNSFEVYRMLRNKSKWQCGFCYTIISLKQPKCKKCGNTRESFQSK